MKPGFYLSAYQMQSVDARVSRDTLLGNRQLPGRARDRRHTRSRLRAARCGRADNGRGGCAGRCRTRQPDVAHGRVRRPGPRSRGARNLCVFSPIASRCAGAKSACASPWGRANPKWHGAVVPDGLTVRAAGGDSASPGRAFGTAMSSVLSGFPRTTCRPHLGVAAIHAGSSGCRVDTRAAGRLHGSGRRPAR